MKFWKHGKDGGQYSTVDGYWLIEIKWLFSIALLRFGHGSRESFHSHAFNCISWVFGPGQLREEHLTTIGTENRVQYHRRSFWPVITRRSTFHRVFSIGTTWVLTFRGPWSKTWREHDPRTGANTTLTHGRKVVQ
jgi:hypothetical protein